MKALRLPFTFDVERLQADLSNVQRHEWVPHFNKSNYEGDWSGIALRSSSGDPRQIYPDPSRSEYFDTPALACAPYFRDVLSAFRCGILAARLLRLKAGSMIREHRDYNLSIEDGEFRVHVPVQTNPELVFTLGGERIVLEEGSAWYLNVNYPHSVHNRGGTDRIHLVFDCVVNDWVRETVAKSSLEQFMERVLDGGVPDEELRACTDVNEFLTLMTRMAAEADISIRADDVRKLIKERRRTWAQRLL